VAGRSVAGVHDCSDGGIAVTLAEMAFGSGIGFRVAPEADQPVAAWCFSESASRVVVSVDARPLPHVLRRAEAAGVHAVDLGVAGGDRLVVDGAIDVSLADAERVWRDAIPNALGATVAG
jgi:phosphoribosylformylglycinamidine synthase